MPDSQHSSPENSPIPTDSGAQPTASPLAESQVEASPASSSPVGSEPADNAGVPTRLNRHPLPSSPVERARLEAQGHLPPRNPMEERSTMVAFGLLFVLPIFIILFAMLLLLPFINSQLSQDPNPGGATMQTNPNSLPPTRQ